MFNINNKVIDKKGKEGFITHRIGNVYVVNIEENNMIIARAYKEEELAQAGCILRMNHKCDNLTKVSSCCECKFLKELSINDGDVL